MPEPLLEPAGTCWNLDQKKRVRPQGPLHHRVTKHPHTHEDSQLVWGPKSDPFFPDLAEVGTKKVAKKSPRADVGN